MRDPSFGDEDIEDVKLETFLVLIGLEPASSYVTNLIQNAGLDLGYAEEFAAYAEDGIFAAIRDAIATKNAHTGSTNQLRQTLMKSHAPQSAPSTTP